MISRHALVPLSLALPPRAVSAGLSCCPPSLSWLSLSAWWGWVLYYTVCCLVGCTAGGSLRWDFSPTAISTTPAGLYQTLVSLQKEVLSSCVCEGGREGFCVSPKVGHTLAVP